VIWPSQLAISSLARSRTFRSAILWLTSWSAINLVESIITRNSAEELGLKKVDAVKIVVKSTEVMIQED